MSLQILLLAWAAVMWFFMPVSDKEIMYPSMTGIIDGSHYANGSIYAIEKERIIIVSTAHLLTRGNDVTVTFFDGTSLPGRVVYFSSEHDVRFVEVSKEQITKETLEKLKPVRRRFPLSFIREGDTMQYAVFHEDHTFRCIQGTVGNPSFYVEEFKDFLIYNYCEAYPGMSGCGMFDQKGHYCGMLIGGYDNESAALSVELIEQLYKKL